MAKNTGMNAADEKAGKTAKPDRKQAMAVNKMLKDETSAPPTTKIVMMVQDARENKPNR